MTEIPSNLPRTQAEWRHYMKPTTWVDGIETKVADWGLDFERGHWYVPDNVDWANHANRIFDRCDGLRVSIDPRYSHDQNRHPEYYRDCYRGEPEIWTHKDDGEPVPIYAPYESYYKARLEDEQRRGVKWDYQYQWLTERR